MDFDARTENLTPIPVRCLPMDDSRGRAVLVAVAKITYAVSPSGVVQLAYQPSPIRLEHELYDAPHAPHAARDLSIKYPSDYVDDKPGTDILVVGTARPPEGRAVTEMDVSVRVGRIAKTVRVYGLRVYRLRVLGGVEPGPAQRLGPTPIRYELAFGGVDDQDASGATFDRKNPVGIGFAETRHKRVGARAPSIEIPPSLVEQSREPAGFGAISAHWSPRIELAGTRDEAWRRSRAPIHPTDFDARHNGVAHPDLRSPTPLRPDEPVEIVGMTRLTPDGAWRFRLPNVAPMFWSTREGVVREHETHLDTFLIDTDERRVELVYRVAIPLPRKAQLLERVTVRASGELPKQAETPEAA